MQIRARRLAIVTIGLLVLLGGCTLAELREQAEVVESLASVTGQVRVASAATGQIRVQAYRRATYSLEMILNRPVDRDGTFQFNLLPGEYAFSAYIDTNGNGALDVDEHGSYPGMERQQPRFFQVEPGLGMALSPIVIAGTVKYPSNMTVTAALGLPEENTGTVRALDEPMFSREAASMGLWRPLDYLAEHGGGILLLEPFDPDRIPVLFVHGIGGTASEFADIIESLDTERFQPWVYQYASGISLAPTADFLLHGLTRLHARHGFEKIVVVAHSMGGLMTRDFVHKYAAGTQAYTLALAVTINSPLHGMDSAVIGVKASPITVPSWRDVASGSAFIHEAHANTWPEQVPYHLVFSYLPGKEGDGTVPLKSQLTRALQREATRIHGFEAGHAAILKNDEFIELLNEILASAH